jgi:imidazolonepropionase
MTTIIRNARVMTCDPGRPGLGIIDRGAVAIDDRLITWVGEDARRPSGDDEIDARGQLVTPGLVDCHTHAIFAGDRAYEFALRAAGKSYLEIAAAGGGIAATLGPTRAASEGDLEAALVERLHRMLRGGTTTVEIKSGYALTTEGELKLLGAVMAAEFGHYIAVVRTLLAHMIPPERARDRAAYVREICEQWIPRTASGHLASSVDVWCETGAFTLDETHAILLAAKRAGLAVRGHVGQMSDLGAAELLAAFGALSADHLEHVSDAGIAALAGAGTVAVMLPGACVQLRLPVPPVEKLRKAGVAMAVATDLNPGSSYCETLPIQMWLATTHYGMTVDEAWLGVTRHAAKALGVAAGALIPGAMADLVMWRAADPAEIPYRYGTSLVDKVFANGVDILAK